MSNRSEEVDAKIEAYQPEFQELARDLRAMIHEEIPGIEEDVAWGKPAFVLRGTRVIYFSPATNHFNLGLYEGALLADPTGLVEGTGKKMRHVKLRDLDEVDEEALRALIRAAAQRIQVT